MKVYFGGYKTYVGPYKLADLLQYVGVSEDRCDKIGDWLSKTWVDDFCEWIESKRKRTIKIKIHSYDVWSLDFTLALIIIPCLEMLKKNKQGVPSGLDKEDYPEELLCPPEKYEEWGQPPVEYASKQWDYVLDEMIWAFKSLEEENDWDFNDKVKYNALYARQEKGFIMFGKYYRALWD